MSQVNDEHHGSNGSNAKEKCNGGNANGAALYCGNE